MSQPTWGQAGAAATISAANSVSVALPATVADGELAFMMVSLIGATTTTITWPAGWTQIAQGTEGGVDFVYGFAWKRLSAADGGTSVTVNFSASVNGAARIGTVLGAHKRASPPWEFLQLNVGTSASWDGVAFTTHGGQRLGVVLYTMGRSVLTSPPANWTERIDSGGGGARTVMDTQALLNPQSVAAPQRVIASDNWATVTIAVLPPPKVVSS